MAEKGGPSCASTTSPKRTQASLHPRHSPVVAMALKADSTELASNEGKPEVAHCTSVFTALISGFWLLSIVAIAIPRQGSLGLVFSRRWSSLTASLCVRRPRERDRRLRDQSLVFFSRGSSPASLLFHRCMPPRAVPGEPSLVTPLLQVSQSPPQTPPGSPRSTCPPQASSPYCVSRFS